MASSETFRFSAVDQNGRRITGALAAADETAAFEQLRREGLSPLNIRRSRKRAAGRARQPVTDRQAAEFLGSLGELLEAGADIRAALAILRDRAENPAVASLAEGLASEIGGGGALDVAFARGFPRRPFVASIVAAGEASGDVAGGMRRAADIIAARLKLQEQLVGVLAYPLFVLLSAVGAVFVILLFIVPSIAPLAADAGAETPVTLAMLIGVSDLLRAHILALGWIALALAVILGAAGIAGLLTPVLERVIVDGPARRTARALLFGGFSVSLGTMLAAGAPMTDALRLALRTVTLKRARVRLEPVLQLVRQGQALSDALAQVDGYPPSIVRLAAVGEATNGLGPMLARGGRLEEEAAMRRIEAFGRIAGPALIVFLGLLLGVLMAGLLSGLSQVGQAALE